MSAPDDPDAFSKLLTRLKESQDVHAASANAAKQAESLVDAKRRCAPSLASFLRSPALLLTHLLPQHATEPPFSRTVTHLPALIRTKAGHCHEGRDRRALCSGHLIA